jgi:hypothetical protein
VSKESNTEIIAEESGRGKSVRRPARACTRPIQAVAAEPDPECARVELVSIPQAIRVDPEAEVRLG